MDGRVLPLADRRGAVAGRRPCADDDLAPRGHALRGGEIPEIADELEKKIVALLVQRATAAAGLALAQAVGRNTIDRALRSLVDRGVVSIDDVLTAPRTRTQYETTVIVQRMPDDTMEQTLLARAPKRRALFEHLRPPARASRDDERAHRDCFRRPPPRSPHSSKPASSAA